MSHSFYTLMLALCVLAEGFFSGSEMALVNADKLKLRARAARGHKTAKLALRWIENPSRLFSVTLLGTNASIVLASVLTTLFIFDHYGERFLSFSMAVVPITLIFGELVPKSVYQHYADFLVEKVAFILHVIGLGLFPIVWFLSKFTGWVLSRVTTKMGTEAPISRDELEMILSEQKSRGDIAEGEITMVTRIFDLAEQSVADIVVPLGEMTAISSQATVGDAALLMEQFGHSRLPVYEAALQNIIGVLHNTDLLFADKGMLVAQWIRPAYVVAGKMALDDLLLTMKRQGEPMAIVRGENGKVTGLVTLEDLIEQVVGDIRDEHD